MPACSCEGHYLNNRLRLVPCRRKATTTRKEWRFGRKGEPPIVSIVIHFCARCATAYDEGQAEMAAEAAVS